MMYVTLIWLKQILQTFSVLMDSICLCFCQHVPRMPVDDVALEAPICDKVTDDR